MNKLLTYIGGLPVSDREPFAARCGTTLGYLRKAASVRQRLGSGLCIAIERESFGCVRCEDLRPDVDWAYLRGSAQQKPTTAVAIPAPAAPKPSPRQQPDPSRPRILNQDWPRPEERGITHV